MKISYIERLKSLGNIDRYIELYQIPCAESIIDFISRFCYTYNPKEKVKSVPFELYAKQEEYIRYLWRKHQAGEDGIVDKCRTAGATWCSIAFLVYNCLFQKEMSYGLYTLDREKCHKLGDISSLVEKAIYILNNLPTQFVNNVTTTHMYIKFHNTASDIVGLSGYNPDRGSRRKMVIKDEAAHYQHPEEIEAALTEVTDCSIDISTHNGTNTVFYEKVLNSTDTFVFEWWDNPNCDQEWYNKKKETYEKKGMLHLFKQEIERDPESSVENVVIPTSWVKPSFHVPHQPGIIIAGLDVADEGGDTNALCIIDGNGPVYIDEWAEGDVAKTTDRAFWKAVDYGAQIFRYDAIGVGAGVKAHLRVIIESIQGMHGERYEIARKMKLVGWNASGAVVDKKQFYDEERRNEDIFYNAKSQAYWKARDQFLETFRKENTENHDENKISFEAIKNDPLFPKFSREISQPQYFVNPKGKILIQKKPKGRKSPNIAESFIIANAQSTAPISWTII